MATPISSIVALDVGAKRIGVAIAARPARLARPLATLAADDMFFTALEKIMASEAVDTVVVGYPRGLQGQHTAQTSVIEDFAQELRKHCQLPIHLQDEALSSRRAEAELRARGKTYHKADIDALAATYILEDWLAEHPELTRAGA